jgi:hypothetical protein
MGVLQGRRSSAEIASAVSTAPNPLSPPNPPGTTAGAVHKKKIEPADNQTASLRNQVQTSQLGLARLKD